jgi:hypothetical protein
MFEVEPMASVKLACSMHDDHLRMTYTWPIAHSGDCWSFDEREDWPKANVKHAGVSPAAHAHVQARAALATLRSPRCACLGPHSDGEVTPDGVVENRAEKRLAEDCADSVPGAVDVHNKLRIRQPDKAAAKNEAPCRAGRHSDRPRADRQL